jgi:hypothetical protein
VAKSVGILSCLLLVAPLASAQIFKCVAKDGTDLYQNFPCGIDSIGSIPPSAPGDKAGSAQSDPKQAKPDAALPTSAVAPTEPRVGMTGGEVKAVWGEPEEIVQDEPMNGGVDIWRYADGRSIRFSKRHRVLAVQR